MTPNTAPPLGSTTSKTSLRPPQKGSARPRYAIITPARDEEEYIEQTIKSVVNQTHRPTAWVIVNDGSKDRTGEIIDRYAAEHTWITAVHREDRGFRAAGSGVMETFYAGMEALPCEDWDFLVKLDGDLSFEPGYFEACLEKFDEFDNLGIGGGIILNTINGKLKEEKHPKFHVRGATKIYRRACWDALGGLIRQPGWDTLDEVKANMLGWESRSFHDLKLVQHRFTGDAAGQWGNWVKNGRACYISGYHPLFIIARSASRVFKKPVITASIGVLYGYFKAMLKRTSQVDDPGLIRFLKRQQLRRLFGMQSIWN